MIVIVKNKLLVDSETIQLFQNFRLIADLQPEIRLYFLPDFVDPIKLLKEDRGLVGHTVGNVGRFISEIKGYGKGAVVPHKKNQNP